MPRFTSLAGRTRCIFHPRCGLLPVISLVGLWGRSSWPTISKGLRIPATSVHLTLGLRHSLPAGQLGGEVVKALTFQMDHPVRTGYPPRANRQFRPSRLERARMSSNITPKAARLQAEAQELADEYIRLSRQSVQTAWKIGDRLVELKRLMTPDQWLDLVNRRMPVRVRGVTSSRFASLRREFDEEEDVLRHESVTQALMSARGGRRNWPRRR